MAKKRKHHSMHHSRGMGMSYSRDRRGHVDGEHHGGEGFEARMNLGGSRRIMMTNNRGKAPISEDFNEPCGIPYGAIQRDMGNGAYYSMNGFRVGDLYEQVDKNMREDSSALKAITKPPNW